MNSPRPQITTLLHRERNGKLIGEVLIELRKLSMADVDHVLRRQSEKGVLFGEAACELELAEEADIREALAQQFEYAYLRPGVDGYAPELTAAWEPQSPEAESLKDLRNQLQLCWFSHGRRSLTVVGVDEDELSSVLIANLGVLFSQAGKQTLLVDANLRNPRLRRIFRFSETQGLADILAGRSSMEAVIGFERFPSLFVLAAGTSPPNAPELLARNAFAEVHDKLACQYDVILYDVPPVSKVSDGLAVAARSDGALLIAKKDKTRIRDLARAASRLSEVSVPIAACAFFE